MARTQTNIWGVNYNIDFEASASGWETIYSATGNINDNGKYAYGRGGIPKFSMNAVDLDWGEVNWSNIPGGTMPNIISNTSDLLKAIKYASTIGASTNGGIESMRWINNSGELSSYYSTSIEWPATVELKMINGEIIVMNSNSSKLKRNPAHLNYESLPDTYNIYCSYIGTNCVSDSIIYKVKKVPMTLTQSNVVEIPYSENGTLIQFSTNTMVQLELSQKSLSDSYSIGFLTPQNLVYNRELQYSNAHTLYIKNNNTTGNDIIIPKNYICVKINYLPEVNNINKIYDKLLIESDNHNFNNGVVNLPIFKSSITLLSKKEFIEGYNRVIFNNTITNEISEFDIEIGNNLGTIGRDLTTLFTANGYTLVGWSTLPNGAIDVTNSTVPNNTEVNYYSIWRVNVTYSAGTYLNTTDQITYGESYKIKAPVGAPNDKQFGYWIDTESSENGNKYYIGENYVGPNITLYPRWKDMTDISSFKLNPTVLEFNKESAINAVTNPIYIEAYGNGNYTVNWDLSLSYSNPYTYNGTTYEFSVESVVLDSNKVKVIPSTPTNIDTLGLLDWKTSLDYVKTNSPNTFNLGVNYKKFDENSIEDTQIYYDAIVSASVTDSNHFTKTFETYLVYKQDLNIPSSDHSSTYTWTLLKQLPNNVKVIANGTEYNSLSVNDTIIINGQGTNICGITLVNTGSDPITLDSGTFSVSSDIAKNTITNKKMYLGENIIIYNN